MEKRKVIMQMVEDMTENPLCPESCGCREYYAEALYDEGYRKESELLQEIERLTARNFELSEKGEKVCIAYKQAVKDTAKEILRMFELWEDKPYVSKEDFKESIKRTYCVEVE